MSYYNEQRRNSTRDRKTKKQLSNMQNMLEECGHKRWKPKYDDRYYYVSEECTAMESRA